jgi:DNA polymerase-3 subunit delta
MAGSRRSAPKDPERAIQDAVEAIRKGERPAALLICGEDDYLRGKAARSLGEVLLPEAERTGFNFRVQDGEREDIPEILAFLRTYSLFGGSNILWVERTRLLVSKFNVEEVLGRAATSWEDAARRDDEAGKNRAAHDVLKVLSVRRLDLDAIDPQGAGGALDELGGAAGPWLHQVHAFCMEHELAPAGEAAEGELLKALGEGWAEGNTLVLVAATCDRRLKLFKALKAHGTVVDVSLATGRTRTDEEAYRKRLAGIAQDEGARMTPGARQILERKVGFDLSRLQSEVVKLATYVGDKRTIDEKAVEEVVGWTREEGQWELSNAVQERHLGRALRALHRTLQHGEAPVRLFFQVAAKVRSLLQARACIEGPLAGVWRDGMDDRDYRFKVRPRVEALLAEGGEDVEPYTGLLKAHPWALFKALEAAGRYRRAELLEAQEVLYRTNYRLVSGGGPAAALLEQMVVTLLSGKRPGGFLDEPPSQA